MAVHQLSGDTLTLGSHRPPPRETQEQTSVPVHETRRARVASQDTSEDPQQTKLLKPAVSEFLFRKHIF